MAKPSTPFSTFNILLLNPQWLNRKYAVERFSKAILVLFSFFNQNVKELALLSISYLLQLLPGFQFSTKVLVASSTVFAVVFALYYIEVDHIPRRKGFIAAAPTLRWRILFSLLPLVVLVYLGAFVSVRSSFFYSLFLPIGAVLGIAINIGITKRA